MSSSEGKTSLTGFSPRKPLTILYDSIRWEEKALYETARKRGIDVETLDCKNLILPLDDGEAYSSITVLQRCVSYFKSIHSTAALEGMGARVINSLRAASSCGNKLFAHMELRKAGIPTPRAISAFSEESAQSALEHLGYPAVIKPTIGSWGRLIALLGNREAARAVIEDRQHMFPLYQVYFFEEFVRRPPRDIRAIVVGEQLIAAIYRYSGEGEWKTNMALGGRAEPCPVTKELEELCLKASASLGAQIAGVDLMESERGGLVVHEVNNTTEFKNTVRVTGVDIPGRMIEYAVMEGKK